MKRYEIEYEGINEITHTSDVKILSTYGDRKEMINTLKQLKKDHKINNVYSVNNNEIYTKIKF